MCFAVSSTDFRFPSVSLTQGRYHKEKHVFFRALPELAKPPPPLPPIRATLSSFFRTSKRRFARMTEKNTIGYDNGFNDNYNSNDGNFDDNNDKKHTNYMIFE